VDPRILDAPACWAALDDLIYSSFSTPTAPDYHTQVLGEVAHDDLESAVRGSGLFMIAITTMERPPHPINEEAWIRGWGDGYPRLSVTYDSPVPVKATTWGRIKGMYP